MYIYNLDPSFIGLLSTQIKTSSQLVSWLNWYSTALALQRSGFELIHLRPEDHTLSFELAVLIYEIHVLTSYV